MASSSTPLENMNNHDLFTHFVEKATTLTEIEDAFTALKARLGLHEVYGFGVFTALQSKLTHWKAKSLCDMLAEKARRKEYVGQAACAGRRVLIVGAGPIGIRLAIECSLLGCEVVVVEKRRYFSRNNVLHLWPCTIDDLRRLGAKKFYGGFCAGAIDHISIKRLQAILMKVALIVGVRFLVGVEFLKISEPTSSLGWHASFNPSSHEINKIDFHVLVGAEGQRQQIPGFNRKELRAKLTLVITANFENYHSQQEKAVEEISGVAFQSFFKQLKQDTGIDLKNIVYYKDNTHYFIMTAKKESLLLKGVFKKDYSDPYQLLAPSNRDTEAMYNYARQAADWSTKLPRLDFALNHKGIPDVDLFDLTSIYQAEYSCRAVRRNGKDLFICLVGDTLLHPFWPEGTGLGRGFLSAMDTAWLVRQMGPRTQELSPTRVLEILAERESIYQRLPQTTPSNIMKRFDMYTINPHTRYPNLRIGVVLETIVKLYITDESIANPTPHKNPKEKECLPVNKEGQVTRALYGEPEDEAHVLDHGVLFTWLNEQLQPLGIVVKDLNRSWSDGLALCGLIYRYHPELIPQYPSLTCKTPMDNCQLAFSVAENHFGFQKILKPSEMLTPDTLALFTYLSLFYEFFQNKDPVSVAPATTTVSPTKEKSPRRSRESSKYRRLLMASPPSAVERSWNTHTERLPVSLLPNTDTHSKSTTASKVTTPTISKTPPANIAQKPASRTRVSSFGTPTSSSDICFFCSKRVYVLERMSASGVFFHRACFKCFQCNCQLNLGNFNFHKGQSSEEAGKFFCPAHYRQLFLSNPTAIDYARSRPEDFGKEETPTVKEATPPIEEEEPEDDEESEQEIKRSLTKRLSSMFRRRSRRSKSPSPEKRMSVKREAASEPVDDEVEEEPSLPAIVESPLPTMRSRNMIIHRPAPPPPPTLSPNSSLRRSGQRTIVRKMQVSEDEVQERLKQQQIFLEAQRIQRDMSQIELQYEELEEVSRDVEQNLRDSEGTSQEEMFMKAWLGLVVEKNALVRRTTDLSARMKILELEDKQLEVEKELKELKQTAEMSQSEEDPRFEKLLQQLADIVTERENIVQQVDQERTRELEEDESHNAMLVDQFGQERTRELEEDESHNAMLVDQFGFESTDAVSLSVVDNAAYVTLNKLQTDICDSYFQPAEIALLIKDNEGRLYQKCTRLDLTDHDKKMAVIDAMRTHGKEEVFQSFIGILESEPSNADVVKRIKDIYEENGGELANNISYHSSKLEQLMKRNGRISMGIIQCMPFGPPRIGKTCVKDRLAGKTPKGEPAKIQEGKVVYPAQVSMSTGAADDVMKLFVEHSSSTTFQEQGEQWVQYDFNQEVISLVKGLENLVSMSSQEVETSLTEESMVLEEQGKVEQGVKQQAPVTATVLEQSAPITQQQVQQHNLVAMAAEPQNVTTTVEVSFKDPLQPVRDAFSHEDSSKVQALLENSLTIHFTDTGGQPEFQEIIPMLVAGPSLFLLVFGLATRLDCSYEIRYDAVDKELEPYKSSFTVQNVMLQCLASIACIGTQRKENGQTKVIRPKVVFIGTQLDLINSSQLNQINSALWEAIGRQGLQHLVERYSRSQFIFAVNNYDKSDASFNALREAISDVAKREEEMYKVNLPVPFVLLDFYLRQPKECKLNEQICKQVLSKYDLNKAEFETYMKEKVKKETIDICDPKQLAESARVLSKCCDEQIPPKTELFIQALTELNELSHQRTHVMKMDQFECIALKCGITSKEELKEALWTLHHLLGTIRHYPNVPELEDTVITDQQLFFNIPTKLITSTFSLKKRRRIVKDSSLIDKFYNEGFFTLDVLNKLWKHEKEHLTSEQLVALLQHLHILAPFIDEDGTPGYFLPCVLKHAPEQCSGTHKSIVDPLLVSFACGFTPNGMLSGLLAFFMKYNGEDGLKFKLRKQLMFRDQASLYVNDYIYVTVKAMPEYIRFSLHQRKAVDSGGIFCAAVKKVIEKGLNELASSPNYNVSAKPRFGFECTCDNPKPTHFTEYKLSPECSSTGDPCDPPSNFTQWFTEADGDAATELSPDDSAGMQSRASSHPFTVDAIAFALKSFKFPFWKWKYLAVSLKCADHIHTADFIEKESDKIISLITHWLSTDKEASWEKLLEAVALSKEDVVAREMVKDFKLGCSLSKHTTTTAGNLPVLDLNNTTYLLLRHEFRLHEWSDLAVSLMLGSVTQEIRGEQMSCLVLLIERWLATFDDMKWENLIEAINLSNQVVVANSLAEELGIELKSNDDD